MNEPKKLSFGFKKVIKSQPKQNETEQKQFIDCLEGKSIKVKGGDLVEEKKPLVIPLKASDKTVTAASLLRIAREVETGLLDDEQQGDSNTARQQLADPPPAPPPPPENETLEQRAARELLQEANKALRAKPETESDLVLPITSLTGQKESTLEDYENIPIADFGKAMLRGMGWTPGKETATLKLPQLRPKGMGLGADKTLLAQAAAAANGTAKTKDEELKIVKGAYVKFISGKHAGVYGQISGFDEDAGRVIVKASLSGENLAANEFLLSAVSKSEYQKFSKVLNVAKYEEFKRAEKDHSRVKSERFSEEKETANRLKYSAESRSDDNRDHRSRKDRHYKDDKGDGKHHSSQTDRKKYSRSDSESSADDRRHSRRSRRHDSSSDSSERRSRDKKRKGKKKKRDRSRSRNRRHH